MANKFKIGDRVVCINAKGTEYLKKGDCYTICDIRQNHLVLPMGYFGYVPQRFDNISKDRKKKILSLYE